MRHLAAHLTTVATGCTMALILLPPASAPREPIPLSSAFQMESTTVQDTAANGAPPKSTPPQPQREPDRHTPPALTR